MIGAQQAFTSTLSGVVSNLITLVLVVIAMLAVIVIAVAEAERVAMRAASTSEGAAFGRRRSGPTSDEGSEVSTRADRA